MVWTGLHGNIVVSQLSVKNDDCPCGWYRFDDSCFLFADVDLTWQDAVEFCHGLDAELIELNTEHKNEFLHNVAGNKTGFKNIWAAGSDSAEEDSWVWMISGSSIIYTNWFEGQPDNSGGNGNCLCVGEWFQFAWDDCSCLQKFAPVCEKSITRTDQIITGQ